MHQNLDRQWFSEVCTVIDTIFVTTIKRLKQSMIITWHVDASRVVFTLIDNSKLANQIATSLPIVGKSAFFGSNRYRSYGRVEEFDSGVWRTICDDTWDTNDASVAYKQLGFTGASSASTSAAHGQGSSPIRKDYMNCVGWESLLFLCTFT